MGLYIKHILEKLAHGPAQNGSNGGGWKVVTENTRCLDTEKGLFEDANPVVDAIEISNNYGQLRIDNAHFSAPNKMPLNYIYCGREKALDNFIPESLTWKQKIDIGGKKYNAEVRESARTLNGKLDDGDILVLTSGNKRDVFFVSSDRLFSLSSRIKNAVTSPMTAENEAAYAAAKAAFESATNMYDIVYEWKPMESKYFKVNYRPGNEEDGNFVKDVLERATKDFSDEFSSHDMTKLMSKIKNCDVYVYDKPENGVDVGNARIHEELNENGLLTATVHLLSPSYYRAAGSGHTSVGEPHSEESFIWAAYHEFSSVFLDLVSGLGKRNHYRDPNWFIQGYECYLAMNYATEHSKTITKQKYIKASMKDPNTIKFTDQGVYVDGDYINGFVLIQFLHDVYGKTRVQAILTSKKSSFNEAITTELGAWSDIGAKWLEWKKQNM